MKNVSPSLTFSRKPISGYKLKEITSSGIYVAQVPEHAAAATTIDSVVASIPPHQRHNISSSSEELSSIYGSEPSNQSCEIDMLHHILNATMQNDPKLVLSTGSGVNGFILDPSLGEFILTHPDIKKTPIPFSQKFPNVDPLALRLLERLIAFDPAYSEHDYEFACSKYFSHTKELYVFEILIAGGVVRSGLGGLQYNESQLDSHIPFMMFQSKKTTRNGLDEAEEDRAKAEAI
ncbi:hypothetical protein L1987_45170 [Smallanthus sonchifolius]|uniref:Uncharacterized protein n=1 Tax=Smallanthus sonchifolius TaxID=185202 RepID=A0ACB9GS88_9ASTR|nr:hypothetical protein L1987_45170 [Smallanthus sonchifolius]